MLYDHLEEAEKPPIYDSDTGEYDTQSSLDGENTVVLQKVLTMSVQELVDEYGIETAYDEKYSPDYDADGNDDTPEP